MNLTAFPHAIRKDVVRARRLEIYTLLWVTSIVVLMGLTAGSSQAMKSAWIEDLLSLLPAIVFLIALHFEQRPPNDKYRHGYRRVNSLAFVIAAAALFSVGGLLLFEAATTLISGEHPTIGPITVFGHTIWQGWLMLGALVYSVIPPVILGRMKLPVAKAIQDKVLHTDALMQRADWMTGLAGIAGVVGVGMGFWWADAVAAGVISFGILRDGFKNLRIAIAELVDGMPRALDSDAIAPDALAVESALKKLYPDAEIRMREAGRYILAQVESDRPCDPTRLRNSPLSALDWRLEHVSFVPRGQNGEDDQRPAQ